MKEKDLERNLDNLIIDGLIKEAEQDNADFEAAMRVMSEDEFMDMLSKKVSHPIRLECACRLVEPEYERVCACSSDGFVPDEAPAPI